MFLATILHLTHNTTHERQPLPPYFSILRLPHSSFMMRVSSPRCLLSFLKVCSCLGLVFFASGDAPRTVVEKEEFHLPPAPKLYDGSESIPLNFDVYEYVWCAKHNASGRSASFDRSKGAASTTSSSSSDTTKRSKKASSDHSRLLWGSSKSSKSKYSRRKPPIGYLRLWWHCWQFRLHHVWWVKRGFAIAIINKPRCTSLSPGGPIVTMNAAYPYLLKSSEIRASFVDVDTSKTIIGGHNFGGTAALYALAELCHGLFCDSGPNLFDCREN
jgi:hypothetical protein